jgi:PKHD-type hydroxylase
MVHTICHLLNPAQLAKAKEVLRSADFIDGRASAQLKRSVKNNEELEVGEAYVTLAELVDHALRQSKDLEQKIFPRFMTRPIINRYVAGMFFKEHVDSPIQGKQTQFGRNVGPYGQGFIRADFSMTLFLDDPASYQGGELTITVNGEQRQYKLNAGDAVFYPTGTLHSVRPVTHGFRTAAVVWIQSMVRTAESRQILTEAYDLYELINQAIPESKPSFVALDHCSNLLRLLAEI